MSRDPPDPSEASEPHAEPNETGEGATPSAAAPGGEDRPDLPTGTDAQVLWKWSQARGLSRRRFVELLGAGGAAAVLAACGDGTETADQPEQEEGAAGGGTADGTPAAGRGSSRRDDPWVKDPEPFIRHPTNLETRLEDLRGMLSPERLFFVRNHAPTPRLDPGAHRVRITGDGVERTVELTYEELLDLPSRSVVAYLECAGNWRRFWSDVVGKTARGGQWGTGGVGCATWSGPQLSALLELAGVKPDAAHVNLVGADDGEFERPMPVRKAMHEDTLLALTMNGDRLPPDHGFPVRGLVPGWVGSSSVKWVNRIVVSTGKIWVKNNTTSYVLVGPEWPAERYAPAEGAPITTQNVKSALALPRPAELAPGEQWIHGFAYSPHAPVTRVEWSVVGAGDAQAGGEREWRQAELVSPPLRWAWRRFRFRWSPEPGSHRLRVRARDSDGNTQPDALPFNEKGYLLNVPVAHPVEVG